ncbi:hypothetical protein N7501_003231 [Penicillium viridicatum]|nr:hypothetical protein N7501_003231 [Penicillium viridicatum]
MNLKTRRTTTQGTGHPPSVQIVEPDRTRETVGPVAIAVIEDMLGFARRFAENARTSAIPGDTEHCGLRTTIQNVNITVPVIDPAPIFTPTSLNAAILSRLDIALHGLHRKAGVPNHSRVMLNNVNITTNILAAEREAPLAPDTSLLDRVQRIPTGPRSNIPNTRPAPTKPTPTKPTFAQSAFARSAFSQPMFGQTAFAQPTFAQNNSVGITPTWPRHTQLSVDSKC